MQCWINGPAPAGLTIKLKKDNYLVRVLLVWIDETKSKKKKGEKQ